MQRSFFHASVLIFLFLNTISEERHRKWHVDYIFWKFSVSCRGVGAFRFHWCKSVNSCWVISQKNTLVPISSCSLYSSDWHL